METLVSICLVVIVSLVIPRSIQAASPSPSAGSTVSLSEIFACQDATHPEWIEFFNAGSSDIDLSTWKIERKSTGDWNTAKSLTATVSAGKYLRYDLSNYLNDSGFFIRLKDNTGAVIETFPEGDTAQKCPSAQTLTSWIKQGLTWSLTTSLSPGDENVLVGVSTPTPSPGPTQSPTSSATPTPTPSATSTPVPTSTATATPGTQPTSVSLSEIYACQNDGEKEWVELMNYSPTSVTLTNWKLTDDDNNEQPIPSLILPGNGFGSVEITKYARGMLTNDGDVVSLFDAVGKKVDSFAYGECAKGSSYVKVSGKWSETKTPSKGKANSVPSPSPSASPTVQLVEGEGADSSSSAATQTGEILGAEIEEQSPPFPSPSSAKKMSHSMAWISYGSIAFGIVLIATAGGWYFWQWRKTRS